MSSKVKVMNSDVLIIGSGPSGLAAAACAAGKGLKVTVLERGKKPAAKVYATGNGRCNYSNAAARFSWETVPWMKDTCGIEPAEEDGRIYPRSFEASSAAEALVSAAERAGAEIVCEARAIKAELGEDAAPGQKNAQHFVVECEDGRVFEAEKLVLATGGKAGIQYGCYGDGYKFAQGFGHSIIKPIPALDGMLCTQDISALHGVRARAKASIIAKETSSEAEGSGAERVLASSDGEVQFTKDCISGICVMDLARYLRFGPGREFILSLDFFPRTDPEELKADLLKRKKDFGCGMAWLVPEKLKDYMHAKMVQESSVRGLKGPAAMAALAKDLRFDITGTRGWKTAQVTCGGVPLAEVDLKNFASLKTKGLYITGELLDYDGPCGGFNLDWALHTGISAGNSI